MRSNNYLALLIIALLSACSSTPTLPPVGRSDRLLECQQLDLAISSTVSTRWDFRSHGAEPFTAHQASVQHVKDGTLVATVVLAVAFGGGGGGAGRIGNVCDSCNNSGLRFAVTAADKREIGLLEIKRDRSCPALPIPGIETTDLEILNQIESTRADLASHRISDQEQMDQQTTLLDQLAPPTKVAVDRSVHLAAAGAVLASYKAYSWESYDGRDCRGLRLGRTGSDMAVGHELLITEHAIVRSEILPKNKIDPVGAGEPYTVLAYDDIAEVRPVERHLLLQWIPIRTRAGSCVYLRLGEPRPGALSPYDARTLILAHLTPGAVKTVSESER